MKHVRVITVCLMVSVILNFAVAWTLTCLATPPVIPPTWTATGTLHRGILRSTDFNRPWLCQIFHQTGVTAVTWIPARPARPVDPSIVHSGGDLGDISTIRRPDPHTTTDFISNPFILWLDLRDIDRSSLPAWAQLPRDVPDSAWPVLPSDLPVSGSRWPPPLVTSFHATSFAAGWPLRSLWSDSIAIGKTLIIHGGLHASDSSNLELVLPFRPVLIGFAANTAFYGSVIWLLLTVPGLAHRHLRRVRGHCPHCAYPIGSSATCAECGKSTAGVSRIRQSTRPIELQPTFRTKWSGYGERGRAS